CAYYYGSHYWYFDVW
nr:immunoglobulin heavy chain junction region [Mus musculus]